MRKTNESGRSMIEMLGVLAIIGVLSVGGIAGYTIAMNQHRANETTSDLMKMAILVSGQRLLQQNGNISSFAKISPYNIALSNADGANTAFTLTVEQVPEAVCSKILSADWTLPTITPTTCSGAVDMTFTFNNDLTDASASQNDQPAAPGLARDVPCGDSFCFHGQTCIDSEDVGDGRLCGSCLTMSEKCCQSDHGTFPVGHTDAGEGACGECAEPNFATHDGNTISCCSPKGKQVVMADWEMGSEACCNALNGSYDGEGLCCRGNGYRIDNEITPSCCGVIGTGNPHKIVARKGTEYTCLQYDAILENADSFDEWHCCPTEQAQQDEWCLAAMPHCS